MSEVKEELTEDFGAPLGKDGSKVDRAIGLITEQLTGLHPDDRKHVLEGLNKLGVLSAGVSTFEKDQAKAREEAVKASEDWVEKVRKGETTKADPADHKQDPADHKKEPKK